MWPPIKDRPCILCRRTTQRLAVTQDGFAHKKPGTVFVSRKKGFPDFKWPQVLLHQRNEKKHRPTSQGAQALFSVNFAPGQLDRKKILLSDYNLATELLCPLESDYR